jgi:hypothetical protein
MIGGVSDLQLVVLRAVQEEHFSYFPQEVRWVCGVPGTCEFGHNAVHSDVQGPDGRFVRESEAFVSKLVYGGHLAVLVGGDNLGSEEGGDLGKRDPMEVVSPLAERDAVVVHVR